VKVYRTDNFLDGAPEKITLKGKFQMQTTNIIFLITFLLKVIVETSKKELFLAISYFFWFQTVLMR